MARNREKKHESLVHQVEGKLKSKFAIGQSKQADKKVSSTLQLPCPSILRGGVAFCL